MSTPSLADIPSPAMRCQKPELELELPVAQQRRTTVLFRGVLVLPHLLVLCVLAVLSWMICVIGWVAALATGSLPQWVGEWLTGWLGWQTRVYSYLLFLTDRYPPFAFEAPEYPIRVMLPPRGRLNRWSVLFRLLLAIPVGLLGTVALYGLMLVSPISWVMVLVTGRMPTSLLLASVAIMRFELSYNAYTLLLTGRYPAALFGDAPVMQFTAATTTRPLVLTSAARALVAVFVILGAAAYVLEIHADLAAYTHSHQPLSVSQDY